MLQLPLTPTVDSYEMEFLLDGVPVVFKFDYNERDQMHYISAYDPATPTQNDGSRDAIVAGLPILSGQSLFLTLKLDGLPPGILFALDTQNDDRDAGRGELGARVRLIYVTEAELSDIIDG